MTETLENFKTNFFSPPSYAVMEGFSLKSLIDLNREEKIEAERILLAALENGSSDQRIIIGLAELSSTKAIPLLKNQLTKATASLDWWKHYAIFVIHVVTALWKIVKYPKSLSYLETIMEKSNDKYTKIDVCVALREFPIRTAIPILKTGLNNEDPLVRCNAARAILEGLGLLKNVTDIPEEAIKIMSDEPAVVNQTRENIYSIIKQNFK